jgi:hypothetical protein
MLKALFKGSSGDRPGLILLSTGLVFGAGGHAGRIAGL